ncbi:MAG: hypothetical protein IKH57_23440 [Clostridia bacterium]|nr:hypothetical protein [Clostridia bacterium]
MYRQHENPYTLEKKLKEAENLMKMALDSGADYEDLIDLQCEISEYKERINFAWQDDEAEVEGY